MSQRRARLEFRNTHSAALGGTASEAPIPPVGYLPPDIHSGDGQAFVTAGPGDRLANPRFDPSVEPTVDVVSFTNRKPGSTSIRHAGKAKSDMPKVSPTEQGAVMIHINDPPGEIPSQMSRTEADELLETQYAPQMGYDIVTVDKLSDSEKVTLYDLLFVSGGYVFYAFFIARTQRYVIPVLAFSVLTLLYWTAIAIVAALVIVNQTDIDLWLYTVVTICFTAIVPFTAFAVSLLEFSRKNTDLSIWHKSRVFMPLLVTILMSFITMVCLTVYNKRNNSDIHRHDVNSYSALSSCMVLVIITPLLIAREIIPAVISSIYPECQGPTSIALAPDTARTIRSDAERIARGGEGVRRDI